eukprot:380437_1
MALHFYVFLWLTLFIYHSKSELTSWTSEISLPREIYNGVYATTASDVLYIIGGTIINTNNEIQPLPRSQLYKWNVVDQHQSMFTHLEIPSSPSISSLYSIT